MARYEMKLNTTPENAAALIIAYGFADLIHEDIINVNEKNKIIVLVFEKYFVRVESRAGVTVIIENTSGMTLVRAITAGVGQGMLFRFDWGASDRMINDIRKCLCQYILEEREM